MTVPTGACKTAGEAKRASVLYSVYSENGEILKRNNNSWYSPDWFPDNYIASEPWLLGYMFDNYFHALAYSLKVKAENKGAPKC